MNREELIRFMAEREVANYDVANDGKFARKLSDFEPWEQKAIVDAMRLTLEDLSAAGFAIIPQEPTPEMVRVCDDELFVLKGAFVSHSIRDGIAAANAKGDILKDEPK